jgi:hypothetical protein
MLRILDKRFDINSAQQQFIEHFNKIVDTKVSVIIGYPGGCFKSRVSWIDKLGIWVCSYKVSGRHVNLFGIGKPSEGNMISMTCEINFPLTEINRRIGGAFVVDAAGDVFVTHRGKIGGGKKGIGKSLFENHYRGRWVTAEDGNVATDVALIGALNSSRFVNQMQQFVFEVDRIKSVSSTPSHKSLSPFKTNEFREEFFGKKKQYKTVKVIEAECDHGLIVNNLSSALESLGLRVGNDRNCDLYLIKSGSKITTIFEIKTDISTTSLYSAIGQLMLNSINLAERPRLILTIPEQVDKTLETKFKKLGIELLIYKWSNDKPLFHKLRALNLQYQ